MKIMLMAFLVFTANALAAPSAKEAIAKVSGNVSTSKSSLYVSFLVPPGTKLNFKGPWKLELRGDAIKKSGLKEKYGLESFVEKDSQFQVPLTEKQIELIKASKHSFKTTYFLCDEKVTWCKRVTAEGEITVTK